MTTGLIYARVSSIGDRQSTERQVKDLSEYAKYKEIEIHKVFEEHSGAKKNDERPVLCEAMEFCKEKRISILLVSELSRYTPCFRLNCQDWGAMRLRCLPLSRNSLTVASTSTYKRNSLHYWTKKDIRPSLPR